tara:strand:+ start:1042 stop:1341 length:300 start_codon:yes stop_codon:yes gene_type:complete
MERFIKNGFTLWSKMVVNKKYKGNFFFVVSKLGDDYGFHLGLNEDSLEEYLRIFEKSKLNFEVLETYNSVNGLAVCKLLKDAVEPLRQGENPTLANLLA